VTGSVPRRATLLAGGVLLAFVLGLLLRLRLGSAEYWYNPDEGLYHQAVTTPSADEASAMVRGLVHPPLYYWILGPLVLLGEDPHTLRLPSLVAGLLAIMAFGFLGSAAGSAEEGDLGGVAGAWFGALVGALSPALALQSVTMRQYSLQALALALGLGALLRYLETGRPLWLVLCGAAFTAAVLLLYTSYLVVGGAGIVLLGALVAGRLSRRQAAGLLCAFLPVLAVMAWSFVTHLKPFVIGGASHREAQETWLHGQFVANPVAGVTALLKASGYAWSRELRPMVLLPVLLSVGLAGRRRRGFAAFVALTVASLAVGLSWSGLVPLGGTRHSLYLVAVQVAAGASGVAWLVGRLSGQGRTGTELPRPRRSRLWLAGAASALLLGSVGTRLVVLVRASTSGTIDAEDEERVIRQASIDRVSAWVRHAPQAFWITDMQTAMLLLPLVPREGRVLVPEPAFGGRRLEALGHSFAMVWSWSLPEGPAGRNDLVELALSWTEGHDGGPEGRVGVITGGWGTSAAWRLARDLRARGQEAAVIGAVGDERLAAVVVEVEALRAWRARHSQGKLR
jgi:hypothetical protein